MKAWYFKATIKQLPALLSVLQR